MRAEGEGDLSAQYWREGHQTYFEREGVFAPDMPLVCERFELVEVF
ncbi:ASCH domain-containing protein [Acinetobacter baumannii]